MSGGARALEKGRFHSLRGGGCEGTKKSIKAFIYNDLSWQLRKRDSALYVTCWGHPPAFSGTSRGRDRTPESFHQKARSVKECADRLGIDNLAVAHHAERF